VVKQAGFYDDEIQADKLNVVKYVLRTRDRLRDAIALANQHAAVERKKSKMWYDRKAYIKKFR